MKNAAFHLSYLTKDFKGELFFALNYFRIRLLYFFYSSWYRALTKMKGIKSERLRVIGRTHFRRFPGSTISFGRDCTIVSSSLENLRGINHPCIFETGKSEASISVGNNCGFSGVSIVSNVGVTIGDNVLVGANVIIGDRDDHDDIFNVVSKPIIIGSNVWIGMNSIILKGVNIGDNVIVGAGSVVTKSIPSGEIWAGNPAKFIRTNDLRK